MMRLYLVDFLPVVYTAIGLIYIARMASGWNMISAYGWRAWIYITFMVSLPGNVQREQQEDAESKYIRFWPSPLCSSILSIFLYIHSILLRPSRNVCF